MNPRRTKISIFVDILRLVDKRGGMAKPTHILYGANLSHIRLNKYLSWLLQEQMLEVISKGGKNVYRITEKGRNFLKEFRKIEQFTDAFGIPI